MIPAPQTQYIPSQQMMMPAYQPQSMPVAYNTTAPYQQPSVYYNYPTASCYAQPQNQKSQFNGVNIEIINPQGQGMVPTQQPYQVPAQMQPIMLPPYPVAYPTSQATVNPPMAPVQPVPVAPMQAPVAQPVQQEVPAQPAPVAPQAAPVAPQPAPVAVAPTPAPVAQPVQQEAPAVPAPQIQQKPEIQTPVTSDPSLSPEAFAGKLRNTSGADQMAVIEDIATKVKNDDTIAPSLLDTQIFDALVDIIDADTSALAGPTPEVIALRQKPEAELSEADKQKANQLSPLEIAEQNKQFALFTISFMQERLNNELEKLNNQTLELKDLPCIDKVVTSVKSNPNPAVRIAGISALSNIAKPQYKSDLTTIFELAKQDEDVKVQAAANNALDKLSK